MATSDLEQAYKDWSKRIARFTQAGLAPETYMPIAQHDLQKAYQTGAAPMTDLEANIAVAAVASGTPPITESPRHGSLLGTIASNVIPDVSNVINALPRGVYDTVKEAVTPSTYGQIFDILTKPDSAAAQAAAQKAGFTNLSPGQDIPDSALHNPLAAGYAAFRLLAQAPLVNLIPGVTDLANAATPAGRLSMEEHPVSTALDLAGVTGKLGEVAAGKIADSTGTDLATVDESSPLSALAKGHVVQAGLRAVDREGLARLVGGVNTERMLAAPAKTETGQRATDAGLGPGQKIARDAAKAAHVDVANRALSTAMNRMSGRVGVAAYRDERSLQKLFGKDLMHDTPRLEAFYQKMTLHPQDEWPQIMDSHELAVAHRIRDEIRPELEAQYGDQIVRTPEGVFPRQSPAAGHYMRMQKAQQVETTLAGRVESHRRMLERAQADAEAHVPLSRRKQVTKTDLARAERVQRATLRLQASEKKLAEATAKVKQHGDAYTRALHTTDIPSNLHPMLAEAIRQGTEQALEGRRQSVLADIPADKLRQAEALDRIDKEMKTVRGAIDEATLRGYLGKTEYEKLKTDSIDYLLQLAREGRAPLYFHSVHADGEYHALSTRIKPLDTAESQLLKHAFNLTTTLQTPFVGLLGESINIGARQGTRQVIHDALLPYSKARADLLPEYTARAQRRLDTGRVRYSTLDQETEALLKRDYVKWNPKTGATIPGAHHRPTDQYIPRDLYENFRHYTQGGQVDKFITGSKLYRGTMRVFRTSVLYGPRHFAHVVIGGLMPVAMAHPTAFRYIPRVWPVMSEILKGRMPATDLVPDELLRPFDFTTENGILREVDTRVGRKYGALLRQYWEQTGGRVTEGLARVEDTAQMMYQAIVNLDQIAKGADPMAALETARRVVVNMDSASPFERTIMKQVMPFYSFTRFATLFLLQLPFDHPIRVSMLASMSNQAIEEWGTGLPMSMISLLDIGSPDSLGNQFTVNLRNLNPFRSVANTFTLGGFFSGLNPAVQAMGAMMGIDTLSGTAQMYPEISYNAQTGDLQTTRPGGDMWTAIESFVPEVGVADAYLGLSSNFRYLRKEDPQAWRREMLSLLNIPFAPSSYNIPLVRGKVALNLYKGAEQALYDAKQSGSFSGDISRYNLVPADLNGLRSQLFTPQQIQASWNALKARYAQEYPGVNPAALVPKP